MNDDEKQVVETTEEAAFEEVSRDQNQLNEYLALFRGLDSARFSQCENVATERVHKALGEAPDQEKYLARLGIAPSGNFVLKTSWVDDIKRLAEPQDYGSWILIVLFLLVSATHIISYGAQMANVGYADQPANFSGVWASRDWVTIITQMVLVLSGEIGILYFFYRHMRLWLLDENPDKASSPVFYFGPNIAIAGIFALVTITANLYSMVAHIPQTTENYWFWVISGVVIGVVIPIINIFLGERVTELLNAVELDRRSRIERMRSSYEDYMRRKRDAIAEFEHDLKEYWHLWDNPQEYKQSANNSYLSYLAAAIIAYYKQYHRKVVYQGQEIVFRAWTPTLEKMLAAREIAASQVNGDLEQQIAAMKLVFTRRESPQEQQ